MGVPYSEQLAAKDARVRRLLAEHAGAAWEDPFPSAESHFRARAKMVVAGSVEAPTLGILDDAKRGLDLRGCGLLGPVTTLAMPVLARFISSAGLRPYDVPARTGELKYLHVTETPDREAAIRFVLRSEGQVGRLRRHLPALLDDLPATRVVSVNLLSEHKAVTEGDTEITLTAESTLPLRINDITLHLLPGAFVQTNTAVAAGLYRQAAHWIDGVAPRSVLDLYCGVGGFALHAASPGRHVTGVEVSEAAVASATRSAAEAGIQALFRVSDATRFRQTDPAPDLVIVNPPRRGLGPALAARLEKSDVRTVVYSSCNPVSLAADLRAMPSWRLVAARLFDMFAQSDHAEVLTLLVRDPPGTGRPSGG